MLLKLTMVFTCSLLTLFIMFQTSPLTDLKKNGFTRKFNENKLVPETSVQLDLNSYFLQKAINNDVILGNYSVPNMFEVYDSSLKKILHKRIHHQTLDLIASPAFNISFSDSGCFVFNGRNGDIYEGAIYSDDSVLFKCSTRSFDRAIPNRNNYIIRYFDTVFQQQALAKIEDCKLSEYRFLPQKTRDGLFSTDGLLIPDEKLNSVLYVYYYRNTFVKLDSNLNPSYVAHMIDTNTVPKISVTEISKTGELKFNKPPVTLFNRGCTDKRFLYIQSVLIADNEEPSAFNSRSTIDIYFLENGKYCCSITIPKHKNKGISSFVASGQKLFAIHSDKLISYRLNHFH